MSRVYRKFSIVLIYGCISAVLCISKAPADPVVKQGAKIVRVDDGTSDGQCIKQNDKLTVTFRGGTLEKQSKWLGLIQDTELGMTFTTSVSGSTGDDAKAASFARVVKESVTEFRPGAVSLAQEQSLVSKFGLTNGTSTFTVVDLDIGIVRTRGKSIGAKILLGAVDATKSLALPKDPFSTAFGVASTYVNSVFGPLLDQAVADKEATSAHITMNIDSANCARDDERTGTKMVVFAADNPANDGYVDLDAINQYCWQVELSPSLSVKFAGKPQGAKCSSMTSYKVMRNSFLAFVVNALPTEPLKPDPNLVAQLPAHGSERSDRDFTPLAEVLQESGATRRTSEAFVSALLGGVPAANLSRAYGLTERTIKTYEEAIQRCKNNGMPLGRCIK